MDEVMKVIDLSESKKIDSMKAIYSSINNRESKS
jgi:hypothetical protein